MDIERLKTGEDPFLPTGTVICNKEDYPTIKKAIELYNIDRQSVSGDSLAKAIMIFDEWNDATGVFAKGTSYYSEIIGVISDICKAIARQSVKSEEVAEAIVILTEWRDFLSGTLPADAEGTREIMSYNLAITALQAYQPVAISKTEITRAVSDGFSYDAKPKRFQCLGCRDYFYMPHPGSYCPNCGRRIIADD